MSTGISQIIAFTQRLEFKTLLEIECKTMSELNPVIFNTVDEFRSMLALLNSVDVLIVDEPLDNPTFLAVFSEVMARKSSIKKIFLLSDEDSFDPNILVFPRTDVTGFMNQFKTIFYPGPKNPLEGYISIPVSSLKYFNVLPFDLFVKISNDKYVKRIPAHEAIDDSTLASFISRGILELYFEKKHNRDFSSMLINNMINKVETEYNTLDEKLLAIQDVYVTTLDIITKLGFKPKIIQVCESVLDQITEDVSSGKDNFAKYMDQLRTQKNLAFHYRLMELTGFISTQILNETGEQNLRDKVRKLIFASMFCDYTLKSPDQVHIRRLDQLARLSAEEQKIISEHALKASEMVNQYPSAPYEASLIIKQHHGSVTGVGLPMLVSSSILPLSKCLITAQEISYQILMESNRHPMDVLSDIKLKFIDSPLEDYFTLFEESCKKNLLDQPGTV